MTMAAQANNVGNNIKCLFVVVLQGVCCFICGSFVGNIGVPTPIFPTKSCSWPTIKLQAIMFPAVSSQCDCVGVFLRISYYLGEIVVQQFNRALGTDSSIGTVVQQGIFSGYFLLLCIIIFILISTSVQSLLRVWDFYNCHIRPLLQCAVLFSFIWLICHC